MEDMNRNDHVNVSKKAEDIGFHLDVRANGKIALTKIDPPFLSFEFECVDDADDFIRHTNSEKNDPEETHSIESEATGNEIISRICPFCGASVGYESCLHQIADMDLLPIWFNGFESVNTIIEYYDEYQAYSEIFDWKECLYDLSLEKIVECSGMEKFEPFELFRLLDGIEIQSNLWTGDMMDGYFFYACVSYEKRDKWVGEFETLANRIGIRYRVEDWKSQADERVKVDLPSLLPGAWTIGEAQLSVSLDKDCDNDPKHITRPSDYFKYLKADCLEKGVKNMLAHPELTLRYRVHYPGSSIHFTHNVTWPLKKKSGAAHFEARIFRTTANWKQVPDDTIFEIWRTSKGILMLTVGGRSKQDACRNWSYVVTPIREFIRRTDVDDLEKFW